MLFETLRDHRLYRFIPQEPYATVEELAERYRHTAAGPRSPVERWYNWAVLFRESRTALGTVEVSILDKGSGAFLAYAFGRDYWGHGYATEAVGAALDFLRSRGLARTVSALIDTRNERSIALVERLHFLRTSLTENADTFKGSSSDEYVYSLTL